MASEPGRSSPAAEPDAHEFRMQLAELLRIAVGKGVPPEQFAEFDRQRTKVIDLHLAALRAPERALPTGALDAARRAAGMAARPEPTQEN